MTDNYINFRRQRELGDIITDTFKFIRENYKLLFKLIFQIAGPVFAVLVLCMGYYYYLAGGAAFFENFDGNIGLFMNSLILLLLSFIAFFVLLQATVFHFIKSYVDNAGKVNPLQVKTGAKTDFGKILGVNIMAWLLVVLGMVMCVIPGIYLWVPLTFAVPLVVFGRKGSLDAIGDAFDLIKDNWWMTFLSLIVMGILMYLVALIFQMPMILYMFVKAFTIASEGSTADPTQLFDWVYVVLSVISSLAQYLLYTIFMIAIAFIYYHLDEKKHATGSFETISNLGTSDID